MIRTWETRISRYIYLGHRSIGTLRESWFFGLCDRWESMPDWTSETTYVWVQIRWVQPASSISLFQGSDIALSFLFYSVESLWPITFISFQEILSLTICGPNMTPCLPQMFLYVSGSAYKIISQRAYHHGTMLISTELETLGNVLRPEKVSFSSLTYYLPLARHISAFGDSPGASACRFVYLLIWAQIL